MRLWKDARTLQSGDFSTQFHAKLFSTLTSPIAKHTLYMCSGSAFLMWDCLRATQALSEMIFSYTNCVDRKVLGGEYCPYHITDKTCRRKWAIYNFNYQIHLCTKQKDASFHAMSQTLPSSLWSCTVPSSPQQLSQPQLQLQEKASHKRLWWKMKKMTCFP